MNVITRLLTDLAACLCEQIRSDGLPEPCFCGVLPGSLVPFDYVGNCEEQDGMAWTRLVLAYPSSGIGRIDTTPNNCAGGTGLDVEIGILRTGPTMDSDGEPPDEGCQLASVDQQTSDMLAMMKAVMCCFGDRDYILGQYRPVGPQGFAVGGTFTLSVLL